MKERGDKAEVEQVNCGKNTGQPLEGPFTISTQTQTENWLGTSLVVQWLKLYSRCREPRFNP